MVNFDPYTMEPLTVDSSASAYQPSAPAPTTAPTTEQSVGNLLAQRESLAAQMIDLAKTGSFGDTIIGYDDFGQPVMGASGDSQKLTALAKSFDAIGDLARFGAGGTDSLDKTGGGGLSESVAAQIAQQDRQLAESMRQFNIGEERANREFADTMAFNRENLAADTDYRNKTLDFNNRQLSSEEMRAAKQLDEQKRANNLSSTLDLLTNQIRTGELGVAEASNRISAATNAANIQRDVLADWGGRALPAGTKYYPNLGPGGPIGAVAQQLGVPFGGFETMGTFGVNPSSLATPITDAASSSMLPSVNGAVANAAAALAGMGVPTMAEGGVVDGPYISGENGPEINFPMGGGRNFVMNQRMMDRAALAPDPAQNIKYGGTFPGADTQRGYDPNAIGDTVQHVMPDPIQHVMERLAQIPQVAAFMQSLHGGAPDVVASPVEQPQQWSPDRMVAFRNLINHMLMGGFGVAPFTPAGNAPRGPSMGSQNIASALAGV